MQKIYIFIIAYRARDPYCMRSQSDLKCSGALHLSPNFKLCQPETNPLLPPRIDQNQVDHKDYCEHHTQDALGSGEEGDNG